MCTLLCLHETYTYSKELRLHKGYVSTMCQLYLVYIRKPYLNHMSVRALTLSIKGVFVFLPWAEGRHSTLASVTHQIKYKLYT